MIFRILVVENSQPQAEKTELILKQSFKRFKDKIGIEAVQIAKAHSASDARRLLGQADGEPYDVMLLDLGLPENQNEDDDPQGGLKIMELSNASKTVRHTIVISVFAEDEQYVAQAFELGAFDVIGKPYESNRLWDSIFACLREILASRRPESEMVRHMRRKIKGESPELLKTVSEVAKVIPHADEKVLLIGETGTGKELFAEAIHELGPNNKVPWEPVNINAYPSDLVESHLFGHEKGAFTGAHTQHIGHLEKAGVGTLFLDEIGELPEEVQIKLLRVIEERVFNRLGRTDKVEFRARLICATNRDLTTAMNNGKFRKDLFHRIAGTTIKIPPLRDRKGDIDVLLNHFLAGFCGQYKNGRRIGFAPETLAHIRRHPFPGNVRELENLVRAAVINCDEGDKILTRHVWPILKQNLYKNQQPDSSDAQPTPTGDLIRELKEILPRNWREMRCKDVEKKILQAFHRVYLPYWLRRCANNLTKAAGKSGMDMNTFRSKWEQAGLGPIRGSEDDQP